MEKLNDLGLFIEAFLFLFIKKGVPILVGFLAMASFFFLAWADGDYYVTGLLVGTVLLAVAAGLTWVRNALMEEEC